MMKRVLCTFALASGAAVVQSFTVSPFHQVQRTQQLAPLFDEKQGGGAGVLEKTKTVTKSKQKAKQKEETTSVNEPQYDEVIDFEEAPMVSTYAVKLVLTCQCWRLLVDERELTFLAQYRLFLIGDEEYEQKHVVTRLQEVVENISEDESASLYKQAYQGGEAMVGKFPLEIAETFAEQLTRSDPIIYADVREDKE